MADRSGSNFEGTVYCDGPDCERSAHIGPDRFNRTGKIVSLPPGHLQVREHGGFEDGNWTFCGWDCLLRFAAEQPPEEIIEAGGDPDAS